MSTETSETTNALNLLCDEVQANPAEAAQRIQQLENLVDQLDALVRQLKGEIQELEAVLWLLLHSIPTRQLHSAILIAGDLLHRKRLDPEARERLVAEYQAWRAKAAANG